MILVPKDSQGWSVFTAASDTRTVYVASNGSDSNDGLTEQTPKATIQAGRALLRDGYPDWLLLRRGDTWTVADLGAWTTSGPSPYEPQLMGTYGSGARPIIQTGTSNGWQTIAPGGSATPIDNVAVVGIEFRAHTFTGSPEKPAGVLLQREHNNFLLEDCLIDGYEQNVSVTEYGGRKRGITIRRCVIVDAVNTTPIDQVGATSGHGIYISATDGCLIEECVLDSNGASSPNIFRHSAYIQNGNTGVVVRDCIFSNAGNEGVQLRCGGQALNNLVLRHAASIRLGGGNDPEPAGVVGIARGNVILDGKNVDANNLRGIGIWLSNLYQGVIEDNIIAHQTLGGLKIGIAMSGDLKGVGFQDVEIRRNVMYNWGRGWDMSGPETQYRDVRFTLNKIAALDQEKLSTYERRATLSRIRSRENRFTCSLSANSWMTVQAFDIGLARWKRAVSDGGSHSFDPATTFADRNRTISTYAQTLGIAASHDAFIAECRLQSKGNWRTAYTAKVANEYFRAGFGVTYTP